MDREILKKWQADPVVFAESCVIRRPDATVGCVKLSDRQKKVLAALGETTERGRPRYQTMALIWPKRSGKTLLTAIGILWKSLAPDRQSVCLSNSREQSQSLTYEIVQEILKRTPEFEGAATVQRNEITFPWGARITCVPCNTRTVSGIPVTGLLVSDELWSAYSEEPYFLLSSQTEGLAAQTFLVSQASGRTKHVYELYQKAEKGGDPSLWFDYITPAEAERGSPNPYLTPEWLESRRQELPRPVFEHYHLNS